jgi:hypothetical protein
MPLCPARVPDRNRWILAKARPPRVYVGDSRQFTIQVRFIGTLEKSGQNLEVCPECLKKVQSISERLFLEKHSQEKGS